MKTHNPWKPISTAPIPGVIVRVKGFVDSDKEASTHAFYNDFKNAWISSSNGLLEGEPIGSPTHWKRCRYTRKDKKSFSR